jgi:hypothetical protein
METSMKFEMVPGTAPVFGWETVDLTLLALAVPATLALFIGLRKDTALFTAVVIGAAVVLTH